MSRSLALAAFAAFVVTLTAPAPALRAADDSKDFFFKPNDRIVFLGDSITTL